MYVANTPRTPPAANENVVVRHRTDSGFTWPPAAVVTVNGGGHGRRFLPGGSVLRPGSCTCPGSTAAPPTAANNSLTDSTAEAFRVNASGTLSPVPIAGSTRRARGITRCFGGRGGCWQRGELAWRIACDHGLGELLAATGTRGRAPAGDHAAGQFSTPAISVTPTCPANETCVVWGGGVPKYGDYNGNACAAGRVYTVCRPGRCSRRPPSACGPNQPVLSRSLVVAASQIQIPEPARFPDICVGTSSTETANVCNTGSKHTLHVDALTSSDPDASSVVRLPRDHRAGQLLSVPGAVQCRRARATSQRDRPCRAMTRVTPSASILVSGGGTQTSITTAIADNGDFGVAPADTFRDQPLESRRMPADGHQHHVQRAGLPDGTYVSSVGHRGGRVDRDPHSLPAHELRVKGTLTVTSSDPLNATRQMTGNGGAPRLQRASWIRVASQRVSDPRQI